MDAKLKPEPFLNYPEEDDLNSDFIYNLGNCNMSSWAVDLKTGQEMARDILTYRDILKRRCVTCHHFNPYCAEHKKICMGICVEPTLFAHMLPHQIRVVEGHTHTCTLWEGNNATSNDV